MVKWLNGLMSAFMRKMYEEEESMSHDRSNFHWCYF